MSAQNAAGTTAPSADLLAQLACPACHGSLTLEAQTILCAQCHRRYPIHDGIPVLIVERAFASESDNR